MLRPTRCCPSDDLHRRCDSTSRLSGRAIETASLPLRISLALDKSDATVVVSVLNRRVHRPPSRGPYCSHRVLASPSVPERPLPSRRSKRAAPGGAQRFDAPGGDHPRVPGYVPNNAIVTSRNSTELTRICSNNGQLPRKGASFNPKRPGSSPGAGTGFGWEGAHRATARWAAPVGRGSGPRPWQAVGGVVVPRVSVTFRCSWRRCRGG